MKKKNIAIIISILVALAVAIAVGLFALNNSTGARLSKQLQLAQKYVSEMNYEEAIIAYKAAIEIDPKSAEAYIGLAKVYIAQDDYEQALAVLQQGAEQIDDEELNALFKECEEEINRRAIADAKANADKILDENIEKIMVFGRSIVEYLDMSDEELVSLMDANVIGENSSSNANISSKEVEYMPGFTGLYAVVWATHGKFGISNCTMSEGEYNKYVQLPDYFFKLDPNLELKDLVEWCDDNYIDYGIDEETDFINLSTDKYRFLCWFEHLHDGLNERICVIIEKK